MTMLSLVTRTALRRLFGLAGIVSLLAACGGEPSQQAGGRGIPVTVQMIAATTVEDTSEFVGTLQAKQRAQVSSEISGRVVSVRVSDGDRVPAGTPLIQINPDQTIAQVRASAANVNAQQASQAGAEASVRTARAQLSAAEANRDNARATLKAQEAELANAEANLKLQQEDFERISFLAAEGVQSQQQLDTQATNRDSARAARDAAREGVNAARSSLKAAEANIVIAREQLQQALASVEGNRAAVDRAQAELAATSETFRFTRVTAPFAGTVGNITVKQGDFVSTGTVLTTVTQDDVFELNLPIPVARASALRAGLPVELLDESSGEAIATGRISFIAPEVDTTSQTILAKASFRNSGDLRDGQFVRARVIWNRQEGILIPTVAVSRVAGKEFVFVVQDNTNPELPADFAASQRPIEVGLVQDDSYQILDGLIPGEQIAVTNILKLRDGVPVQPETAASSTEILTD
ncbi:MAG: efflux RND transporter periplasmic adaptor subunit [Spirulinaceae cyanobacterium SM2_1_0]|nr:efflux RND transporter periplasmic adaptor subunit [Spirulinaceae cyanobacterium SM2_1_0]